MSLTTQTPQQIYDNQHPVERGWEDFSYSEKKEYLKDKYSEKELIKLLVDNDCGHVVVGTLIEVLTNRFNKLKKELDLYIKYRKQQPHEWAKWKGLADAKKQDIVDLLHETCFEYHDYTPELINTVMDNSIEI